MGVWISLYMSYLSEFGHHVVGFITGVLLCVCA